MIISENLGSITWYTKICPHTLHQRDLQMSSESCILNMSWWNQFCNMHPESVLLLLVLLGMRTSSSCSWILDSSSAVNLHLLSAACAVCCGCREPFFLLSEVGEGRQDAGMAPVVRPSGNFCAITLRPRGSRQSRMKTLQPTTEIVLEDCFSSLYFCIK